MDRRLFLASALGIGALVSEGPAQALQITNCDEAGNTPGCRALDKHDAFLRDINEALAEQGVGEQERALLMARLNCPTCGMPLVGTAGVF